jgi:hypothetical protein
VHHVDIDDARLDRRNPNHDSQLGRELSKTRELLRRCHRFF